MRDLSSQITVEEMVEFEAVMNGANCGAHDDTIVCRDCMAIFALRVILELRTQLTGHVRPGPRPRGLHKDRSLETLRRVVAERRDH